MRSLLKLLLSIAFILGVSCNGVKNEVYYTYDNIVIKRIDQENKTTLFYMKDGVPIDTIWTTYSGFTDSWFDGRLYFMEDSTVLVSGLWHRHRPKPYMFKLLMQDCPVYFKEQVLYGKMHITSTPEFRKMADSLKQQGRMYYIVSADPKSEFELFNKDNPNTQVQTLIQYP